MAKNSILQKVGTRGQYLNKKSRYSKNNYVKRKTNKKLLKDF